MSIDKLSYFYQAMKNDNNKNLNDIEKTEKYYQAIKSLLVKESTIDKPIENEEFDLAHYSRYYSALKPLYQKNFERGCEINTWEISGLKRDEIRNTAVLAWWLDKKATHGLGSVLLEQVLKDHIKEQRVTISCQENDYIVQCESLPLKEIENRIDIEIIASDFLMFWEVKIDALEGKNGKQLEAYYHLLERKANIMPQNHSRLLIYLTKQKQSLERLGNNAYSITWENIRHSFSHAAKSIDDHLPKKLLLQYCEFIKRFK